jgi:hypothetical protein
MPWLPELFTAPALEHIRSSARQDLKAVPYFQGLASGETEALIRSFAGEPELHHPVFGRVRGRRAFEQFVAETNAWLFSRNAVFHDAGRIVTPARGIEETLIALDVDGGRVELPVAVAADRDEHAHIKELRVYFSTWPTTGRHTTRTRLLQNDPGLRPPDVVGDHLRAYAAGDVDAVVALFEPDGYVREPSGEKYLHRGRDEVRALYEQFFSAGGGVPLELCALTDDGRDCALEYNVVRWGRTEVPPEAGIAVYARGTTGKLAAVRVYDDSDPP